MKNSLPLNVPFLPDEGYVQFLLENEERLQSVHFSLCDPLLQDARIHIDNCSVESLVTFLGRLKRPKKYVLANGRFHPDTIYGNGEELTALVKKLECLVSAGQLDGVVFADSYMLTVLSDSAPFLAAAIEAVPSVNFAIDDTGKLAALIQFIGDKGFKPPAKITVDRSLNRKPESLYKLRQEIGLRWPKIAVELLANEGCLPYCPFRATHEALISIANCRTEGLDTRKINNELACVRLLTDSPFRLFSSPFIRPEDVISYHGKADVIKLCGRTLGPAFLQRTIMAYISGAFQGNLLNLLDAANWMAEFWELPNDALPANFLEKMVGCKLDCSSCSYCKTLFERLATVKPLQLIDRRGTPS